ncbi:cytosine permease [Planosporangium thailandense]|uniref:Cytosine permease n=1 Tax=Planosporangium thailandense TaxID=765197 RepID=A0ABX0XXS0_9ACTN|nr:cytosine permease [Planosporangium thailandense]NJC69983.1 cytosine permease [Planosporangium thailandense]
MARTGTGGQQGISGVERRSIDYIPLNERHGKAWEQGPFWMTGGMVLPSLLIGFIGPSLGLGLGWTLLALIAGMAFGTLFMALHANQGPLLGLPQMIQSRAQFGARGAMFPMLMAVFIYIGYNVFYFILCGDAVSVVLPGGKVWYIVFSVIALVIAIVGHDLLHTFQRWSSYFIIVVFAILTVVMIVHYPVHGAHPVASGWSFKAFLVQFAAAGGYQISYAIYVSDYTRYLPEETPQRKLIGWTFVGAMVGAGWMGCLGALIGAYIKEPDAISALHQVGDYLFPGFGAIIALSTIPAMVGTSGVNAYGAMLTGATIVDGIRHVQPTLRMRIVGLLVVSVIGTVLTLVMPADYLNAFNTFLGIMVYLLVPWTAVNLVDFYLVRRGHYSVDDIVNPRGAYGQWSWRGLTAYFAGFIAMIPFFSLSFYVGPVTKALGGADFSFVVGLLVAGVLYLLICRNLRATESYQRGSGAERQVVAL